MPTNPQVLGLPIQVDWGTLRITASFFVPVPLGMTRKLWEQLQADAAPYGYELLAEEVAEKGMTGLRVWRIR